MTYPPFPLSNFFEIETIKLILKDINNYNKVQPFTYNTFNKVEELKMVAEELNLIEAFDEVSKVGHLSRIIKKYRITDEGLKALNNEAEIKIPVKKVIEEEKVVWNPGGTKPPL